MSLDKLTPSQRLSNLLELCCFCVDCELYGYQTPPVFGTGNPEADIVVIAQNPGEIEPGDEARQWWIKSFEHNKFDNSSKVMKTFYRFDFEESNAYKAFSSIFGPNWLDYIFYTNSVRCRTQDNEPPTDKEVKICKRWTGKAIKISGKMPKLIVLVGGTARKQILEEDASQLQFGQIKKRKDQFAVLAIKHYSAWKNDEATGYKKTFDNAVKKLDILV